MKLHLSQKIATNKSGCSDSLCVRVRNLKLAMNPKFAISKTTVKKMIFGLKIGIFQF